MLKLLCFALFSLIGFSGCAHEAKVSRAASHSPDREFNPVTGNNERQPPFGPRSNKSVD